MNRAPLTPIEVLLPSDFRLYPGKWRDDSNSPLNGIFRKSYKNGKDEVIFILNGHANLRYKFPHLEKLPFQSSLHRWHNLLMCGGIGCGKLSGDDAILDAVVQKQKPLGDILAAETAKTKIEKIADQTGLEIWTKARTDQYYKHNTNGEQNYDVLLAQPGTLGELFDLEAVISSYDALLSRDTSTITIKDQCLKLFRSRLNYDSGKTLIKIFGNYEWASPEDPDDLMMTGLVLGYPIESTYDRLFS